MELKRSLLGFLKLFFIFFVVLSIVVVARTFLNVPKKIPASPCSSSDEDFIPAEGPHLERFKQAITLRGVSYDVHRYEAEELQKTRDYIIRSFPTVHSSRLVTYEVVANYSLLYTIRGSDDSLQPFLLMGHFDVVPVENHDKWEADPFGGKEQDGFIYGRGTIDNKQTVFGILEALEFLLKNGHNPKRSFYLAFGHDEETGGEEGASSIAKRLEERGVRQLEFILDEGMTVLDGIIPGMSTPVALIGSSEKGYLSLRMSLNCTGGHSSMPEAESCIGIMAKAVTSILSKKPSSNAMIRTTTAVTMFNSGVKENVIAPYAVATVNHRIHPSSSVAETLAYDKQIVNDARINWEVINAFEPLPKSPYGEDDFGYQTIRMSIEQIWRDVGVTVAPATLIGNTDTRHYLHLSKNIYRFSPTYMYPDDPPRFHGVNERISVKNWEQAMNFFLHLLKNADEEKLPTSYTHSSEL